LLLGRVDSARTAPGRTDGYGSSWACLPPQSSGTSDRPRRRPPVPSHASARGPGSTETDLPPPPTPRRCRRHPAFVIIMIADAVPPEAPWIMIGSPHPQQGVRAEGIMPPRTLSDLSVALSEDTPSAHPAHRCLGPAALPTSAAMRCEAPGGSPRPFKLEARRARQDIPHVQGPMIPLPGAVPGRRGRRRRACRCRPHAERPVAADRPRPVAGLPAATSTGATSPAKGLAAARANSKPPGCWSRSFEPTDPRRRHLGSCRESPWDRVASPRTADWALPSEVSQAGSVSEHG
jgi:hypothetical protein